MSQVVPVQVVAVDKKKKPRKRRARSGLCPAVTGMGTRRTKIKRSYDYFFDSVIDAGNPSSITISLIELLGGTGGATVAGWFDEFKITQIELWCVGIKTKQSFTNGSVPTLCVVSDLNDIGPADAAEMMRMAGHRVFPLDFSRGPMKCAVCKPTISKPSGEFETAWLKTGSTTAQGVKWYGFHVSGPETDNTLEARFILKAVIAYRGNQ